MREQRWHFHQQLQDLELHIQDMSAAAQDLFDLSLRCIASDDPTLCQRVIDGDDLVDGYFMEIERGVMDLFALQTPVASDLRLLTVLLHVDLHLERVADMAVNIAKIVQRCWGLPRNTTVLEQLEEMGGLALRMQAAAMDAFARRDLELSRRLTVMDEAIDRLNRGMLNEVLEAASDKAMLEWGVAMHVVSREIERVGDHAVDIGEQVAFLITGEFVEFTDASHPEVEHPGLAATPTGA
ncbi:MAG: phosphate signaling complex protein PhoU [Actinomycetota bacterium]